MARVSWLSPWHSARFKALNTDDDKTKNTYYMETMVSKTFTKVIGFFASLLLSLFAGLFAMLSLSSLIMSIVDKDFLSVVLSAFAGFVAWMIWSVRKDTLS